MKVLTSDSISWVLCILLTIEVVPEIYANLNLVAHLVVPAD